MKKQNEKSGLMKKILLSLGIIFLLILTFLYIFGIQRPFMGEITEDRPIIEFLCELQLNCRSGEVLHQCYSAKKNSEVRDKHLVSWKDYKGCNESTENFYKREDGYKGIYVKSCSCGGLM
jgi:hypothetical protein